MRARTKTVQSNVKVSTYASWNEGYRRGTPPHELTSSAAYAWNMQNNYYTAKVDSYIVDSIHDRTHWKPCYHQKNIRWSTSNGAEIAYATQTGFWFVTGRVQQPVSYWANEWLSTFIALNPLRLSEYQLDDAFEYAYFQMLPKAEDASSGAQAAVFALELADARRLVQTGAHFAKGLLRLFRGTRFTSLSDVATFLLNSTAEARLSWSFAIAPFVSDLQRIYSSFKTVDEFVRKWNADSASHTWRTRHYDITPLVRSQIPSTTEYSGHFAGIKTGIGLEFPCPVSATKRHSIKSTAHLSYVPKSIPYDPLKRAGILFDMLGGGDGASLVWEMIPFSFLVDYLIDIGALLDTFSRDLVHLPIHDIEFYYSVKRSIEVNAVASSPGGSLSGIAGAELSVYDRQELPLPDIGYTDIFRIAGQAARFRLPSLRQLENVAALIVALIQRRK